jgi:hypothetical protein
MAIRSIPGPIETAIECGLADAATLNVKVETTGVMLM